MPRFDLKPSKSCDVKFVLLLAVGLLALTAVLLLVGKAGTELLFICDGVLSLLGCAMLLASNGGASSSSRVPLLALAAVAAGNSNSRCSHANNEPGRGIVSSGCFVARRRGSAELYLGPTRRFATGAPRSWFESSTLTQLIALG